MMSDLKSRAKEAVVATAVMHPVATVVTVLVVLIAAIYFAYLFLSAVASYIVFIALAVAAYYLISTGALSSAVAELRSHPRDGVMVGLLTVAFGIALPFVVHPVPYASLSVSTSFSLSSAPGIFGFFAKSIDLNTFSAQPAILSAYYGAPLVHVPSSPTDHSSSPGDGWYICVQAPPSPRFCWQVPAVDFLSTLSQGDQRQYTFVVNDYPLPSDHGALYVTLYYNGAPAWQRAFQYFLTSSPVLTLPGSETNSPTTSP